MTKLSASIALLSPYDPIKPKYLQIGLTRQEMETILTDMGI